MSSEKELIAERLFEYMDANNNGVLEKFELLEFCKEHEVNVAKLNRQLGITDKQVNLFQKWCQNKAVTQMCFPFSTQHLRPTRNGKTGLESSIERFNHNSFRTKSVTGSYDTEYNTGYILNMPFRYEVTRDFFVEQYTSNKLTVLNELVEQLGLGGLADDNGLDDGEEGPRRSCTEESLWSMSQLVLDDDEMPSRAPSFQASAAPSTHASLQARCNLVSSKTNFLKHVPPNSPRIFPCTVG